MSPPEHFVVEYAINPWMHPGEPASAGRAGEQWQRVRDTYLELGHTVLDIEPTAGQPEATGGSEFDSWAEGGNALGDENRSEKEQDDENGRNESA